MPRRGTATIPLHTGSAPPQWLFDRMVDLGDRTRAFAAANQSVFFTVALVLTGSEHFFGDVDLYECRSSPQEVLQSATSLLRATTAGGGPRATSSADPADGQSAPEQWSLHTPDR